MELNFLEEINIGEGIYLKKTLISLFILQVFFISIVFIFNPRILITINNDEFNELLMNKTYYGFPKSSFIIAILKENWFRPKSCKIILITEHSTYNLERGFDNPIRYYIINHANYRVFLLIFYLVIDFIIMLILKYKKTKNPRQYQMSETIFSLTLLCLLIVFAFIFFSTYIP